MLRRLALAGVVVVCGIAASACQDEQVVPDVLADGTAATLSTVAFEGVETPVIATQTRAARTEPPASCAAAGRAIDRVGVVGASRTILARGARELLACDWTAPSRWCGKAFARLRPHVKLDPRLSVTCRDADGDPVGFLWISPGPGTAFVVVVGDGYAESYPLAAGAPVRVTTHRVDVATSSAALTVSEHTRGGSLLRARRIAAQVSG